jgi:hypothetical protein
VHWTRSLSPFSPLIVNRLFFIFSFLMLVPNFERRKKTLECCVCVRVWCFAISSDKLFQWIVNLLFFSEVDSTHFSASLISKSELQKNAVKWMKRNKTAAAGAAIVF